jgi:hypothetical protein
MLPPTSSDGTTFYSYAPDPGGAGPAAATSHAWKDGSFSFHDVLDTLNPLQHLPIVNTLYRWITGDEPGNVASIVGDTLYGGPIGLGVGLLSAAFKAETGKDPGEMMASALTGEDDGQVLSGVATAQSGAAPATAAATAAASPTASGSPAATAATTLPTAAANATSGATPATAAQVPVTAAAQPLAVSAAAPHPFLPLFRSPPPAAPAPASSSATGPSEQAFLAQNAAYMRSIYGQRGAGAQPQTAPIPLQLTGAQQSFAVPPRPPAALPAPTSPATTLPPNVPTDIPQRMMEALDKYARMKQQQEQQQQQRGQQVDVAP